MGWWSRSVCACAVLLALASQARAATYEVSPGQSLSAAISQLAPGDTLYLRGGTYADQIGWPHASPPSGSSWDHATTIASYPGETAILTQPIAFSTGQVARYIILDRLTLNGTELFLGLDTDHIRFSNGDIQRCPAACVSGGGAYHEVLNSRIHDAPPGNYGVYFWGHDTIFDGNEVFHNGGYGYHIYNTSQQNVSNNIIRNGFIHDNGLSGGHGDGTIILANGTNNQAYNNRITGNSEGIQIGSSCVACQVYNNTITGNMRDGIVLEAGATHTVIRENILAGNGGLPIRDHGANGTMIAGNVMDGERPTAGVRAQPEQPPPGPVTPRPGLVLPPVPPPVRVTLPT